MSSYTACVIVLILIVLVAIKYIADRYIIPYVVRNYLIIRKNKNPIEIVSKLYENYYGFDNIDVILAQEKILDFLPIVCPARENRLEILLPIDRIGDFSLEEIAQVALAGKLKIQHKLKFFDKPAHWLSILCYFLDGGDIKQTDVKWENRQ